MLHGGLREQGVKELFILTTFQLQPKGGSNIFSLYNPQDNSKYFEFTVLAKLNKGESNIPPTYEPWHPGPLPTINTETLQKDRPQTNINHMHCGGRHKCSLTRHIQ